MCTRTAESQGIVDDDPLVISKIGRDYSEVRMRSNNGRFIDGQLYHLLTLLLPNLSLTEVRNHASLAHVCGLQTTKFFFIFFYTFRVFHFCFFCC